MSNAPTPFGASAAEGDAGGSPGPSREDAARDSFSESRILKDVLAACRRHPFVAWVERMNSGAAKMGGRWVKFGFTGCPDVIGQVKSGELLAIECKAATGRVSKEQVEFLGLVARSGGCAFVARSGADAVRGIDYFFYDESRTVDSIAPPHYESGAG